MRWRIGRRTRRWMTRTAKKRKKTRRDPGQSSPCYWHRPRRSWPRWLWCGAGCHLWLLSTSAAQHNASSPGGSVGRSPLLFCYSRGSPSRVKQAQKHLVSAIWFQRRGQTAEASATEPRARPELDYLGGSGAPPIILIAKPLYSPTTTPLCMHTMSSGSFVHCAPKMDDSKACYENRICQGRLTHLTCKRSNSIYRAIKFRT